MRNKILTLLILMIIALPIINATSYPWYSTISNCNDYKYYFGSQTSQDVYVCSLNGLVIYTGYVNGCNYNTQNCTCYYTTQYGNFGQSCSGVKINSAGQLVVTSGAYTFGGVQLSSCTAGNCNYYICANSGGSGNPCNINANYTNCYPITNFPVYSNCTKPWLSIDKSQIMSDRYRFTFTQHDVSYWSNIYCLFTMSGQSSYFTTTFDSSGLINYDVMFNPTFPRQFVTGSILCSYKNAQGQTEQYFNQPWMIDAGQTYEIYDLYGNRGKVTPQPYYLAPSDNLTSIIFRLLSAFDRTDYAGSVDVILSTTQDLPSIGCSGTINKSTISGDVFVTEFGSPFDMDVNVICQNNATIPVNFSVYSKDDSELMDYITFNLTWNSGNMVIDNINLIKNMNTSDMELWATVSNKYTQSPIGDIYNLSCNYSVTSLYNGTSFSGSMNEYRTYGQRISGYATLIQTDVRNSTIDSDTGYNYGSQFEVDINCSAENYSYKQIATINSLGYKRLNTFKCSINKNAVIGHSSYVGSGDYVVSYDLTDGFYTLPVNEVRCTIVADTTVTDDTPLGEITVLTNIAAGFGHAAAGGSELQLDTNIHSYISQSCPDKIKSDSFYNFETTSATASFDMVKFHERDAICSINRLINENISAPLVHFSIGNYIAQVFAVVSFDLVGGANINIGETSLQLAYNKTSNAGVVEKNDSVLCSTFINTGQSLITSVVHKLFFTSSNDTCNTMTSAIPQINGSRWSTLFIVNTINCPFLNSIKDNDSIQCIAYIYKFGVSKPEVRYSNELPYMIPLGAPPFDFGASVAGFFGGIGEWAVQNPIAFMIACLLAIITETTWSGIIISAFNKAIGRNEPPKSEDKNR